VSASCLRNWERLGLVTPTRTQGRYRLYSKSAVRDLKRISYLRRVQNLNPAGIVNLRKSDPSRLPHVRPDPETPDRKGIGQRLKNMRNRASMSIGDASVKSGFSRSFIEAVERGAVNASVASLKNLARAYGGNLLSLFEPPDRTRCLVRPQDRQVLDLEQGVRMELLALGNVQMQPYVFRIAAGTSSGGSYQHEGEEFLYVLHGKLEIWLDEVERYVLELGDGLYFASTRAHRWRCIGKEEAVILWINSPAPKIHTPASAD
jgi:DNA-binding transcriptional MerR regulator/quercetin dioxygenase-like cupin family protein